MDYIFHHSLLILVELVVEVIPSVEGVVTSGTYFELTCQLDTGEEAPSVLWRLMGVVSRFKFHALIMHACSLNMWKF